MRGHCALLLGKLSMLLGCISTILSIAHFTGAMRVVIIDHPPYLNRSTNTIVGPADFQPTGAFATSRRNILGACSGEAC